MNSLDGYRVVCQFGSGMRFLPGGGWWITHANLLSAWNAGVVEVEVQGKQPGTSVCRVDSLLKTYEGREAA